MIPAKVWCWVVFGIVIIRSPTLPGKAFSFQSKGGDWQSLESHAVQIRKIACSEVNPCRSVYPLSDRSYVKPIDWGAIFGFLAHPCLIGAPPCETHVRIWTSLCQEKPRPTWDLQHPVSSLHPNPTNSVSPSPIPIYTFLFLRVQIRLER